MQKNVKWSAIILGASLAMTAAMPAIPVMAASHHGAEHGDHGWHGHHGQHDKHNHGNQHNKGSRHGRNTHDHHHDKHGKGSQHRGPQGEDRLRVTRSDNHVTASEAAMLSGLTLPQGTASTVFAQGTPFTVYTVRIVGPHAHWSGTGSITISDNNGGLTTPADLYYLGFERGFMHPDPFQGDTAPYNASTVGQSSNFSVRFERGQAQFAVFDAQAGSGPIQITVQDQALHQSKTVTYPDVATTTTTTATAAGMNVVGSPTVNLALGQSATVEFQVTDQNGQPLTQSGQTVDLYLAGAGTGTVPTGVTLNGETPSASSPLALQTSANGTVSATLTNVSDTTGATYDVDAMLAGATTAPPAHITVTDTAAGTFAQPVWSANTPNASNVNADFANMFGSWGIFSLSNNGQNLTFNEGAITSQVKTNNGDWQSPSASPWKAPVVFAAPTPGATETSISATLNGSSVSSANLPFTSLDTDANYSAGSDALAWLPETMQPGNWVFTVQWSTGQVTTYNVTVNAAAGTLAEPQWSANTPNATNIQTDFNTMYASTNSGGWGIFSMAGNGQSVTFNESAITSQVKTNNGDWQSPTASPWKAPVVFVAPTAGATEVAIAATLDGNPVSAANLPFTSLDTDANYTSGSDALAWLPENMASGTWVFSIQWSNGQVVNYTVIVP